MRVTITANGADWQSLLDALPKCGCGAIAELELNGRRACCMCAASVRHGRCKTLPWADAATAIVDALSPHISDGRWEGGECG